MQISLGVIITMVVLTTGFFLALIYLGLKAQKRKKAGGVHGIVGETGTSLSDIEPGSWGNVRVHGEIWKAASDGKISTGDTIEVIEIKGLTVKVKPVKK